MKLTKSNESGQAIVLLVISLVVLLGFTALAIDGGMVYSDRRQAKNAADTAALTGMADVASRLQSAGIRYQNWDCASILSLAEIYAPDSAAYRAQTNGYSLDPTFDEDGVDIICNDVGSIPVATRSVDVFTAVRSEVQTSFAHVLTSTPLQNYVESAATLFAPPPFGAGFALLALNEDSCSGGSNGLIFGGSAVVEIEEGSAFTNCCLSGNGIRVNVTTGEDGGVYYYDTDDVSCGMDGGTFPERLSDPQPADQQYPRPFLALPDLSERCDEMGPGQLNGTVYTPGYYDGSIIINAGDTREMQPGLYCLRNSPTALRVNGGGTLTALGVTLYIENGGVTIDGNAMVTMGAPCSDLDANADSCSPTDVEGEYPYPALPHIMMFVAEGNDSTVILSGTNETVFMGTIYAPDGDVVITGRGQTWTWETQIVANNITVEGTPTLNIEFDNDSLYQFGLRLSTLQ